MHVEWMDIVKLTVPFITAILMVWIKAWIESRLERKHKQHALSRVINEELHFSRETVLGLSHIAESATNGKLRLVSIDVSTLLEKFAYELADLDSKQAYLYADLASSVELVNKGLSRLYSLMLSRSTAIESDVAAQLDRVIYGQARITAADYISLCKVCLTVFEKIPMRHRYGDDQALKNMRDEVVSAENTLTTWPGMSSHPPTADPRPRREKNYSSVRKLKK